MGELDVDARIEHARTMLDRGPMRVAKMNPQRGDQPMVDRRRVLDTEAILDPGRPTRVLVSIDVGYATSGWFANSDWERCWHISVSHPDVEGWRRAKRLGLRPPHPEAPDRAEVAAWAQAAYGDDRRLAWYEPPASAFDINGRTPGVWHVRLYLHPDTGLPFKPEGEPHHYKPHDDITPPKADRGNRVAPSLRDGSRR